MSICTGSASWPRNRAATKFQAQPCQTRYRRAQDPKPSGKMYLIGLPILRTSDPAAPPSQLNPTQSMNTSNVVSIHPYFKVHPGKLAEFKAAMPAFVEKTKAEPLNLYYEFTSNGDEIFCREGYDGAEGVLAHLDNVGPLLAEASKNSRGRWRTSTRHGSRANVAWSGSLERCQLPRCNRPHPRPSMMA